MRLIFGLLLFLYVFVAFALLLAFILGARDHEITTKFVFIGIVLTLLWPAVVPVVIAAVIVQSRHEENDYLDY